MGQIGCCGCFLLSLIDRQCGRSRNRMGTETWPERNSQAAENSIGFFSSVRLKLQSYPRIFSSVPKSLRGVSILRNATLSISCDCNGSNQFLCRMNVECIFPFPLFISMRFAVQTKCSSIRPSMSRSRSEEMCSYLHGGGGDGIAFRPNHKKSTQTQKLYSLKTQGARKGQRVKGSML